MSVIGIVCEFNPFHNGHKYLIDSVKQNPEDTVVAVMSGNFVQRCSPAVFTKKTRTRAALLNGVDIVLELPFLYACATAEIFAENAVRILSSFGCDSIAFGTESAGAGQLENTARVLLDKDFDLKVKKCLEQGCSYPYARQKALAEYEGMCDLSTPNNILAAEYVKAVIKNGFDMKIMPVKRVGAGYNDNFAADGFASATYIRNLIENGENAFEYFPENCRDIYSSAQEKGEIISYKKYELAVLAILRSRLGSGFQNIAYADGGLENRLTDAVINALSLEEIYDRMKTKRYTHSRVRRAVLSAAASVTKEDLLIKAPYCRLLGFRTEREKIMGSLARASFLPFVSSAADISATDENARRVFALETVSGNIYNTAMQNIAKCNNEMTYFPEKMK